jgi:hypothetical protein
MIDYEILFDASTVSFTYGRAVILLLISAVAIWWCLRRLRAVDYRIFADSHTLKASALSVIALALFGMVGRDWWEHREMQAAISRGEGILQVEGVVQDHWIKEPARETGDMVRIETVEHFRIADVHFQFAQTDSDGRYFTNAGDHAVKLQDGMRLRIAYIAVGDSNRIVKLEVAR